MNQFLDKNDGKWHITMFVDIPRVAIRNHLNFRIFSTTSRGGIVTKDPAIPNSNCSFHITPNLLGRKVFFNIAFSKASIANVDVFRFGLCDEMIGWHHSTFLDIKNEYYMPPIVVKLPDKAPDVPEAPAASEVIIPPELVIDLAVIEPEITQEQTTGVGQVSELIAEEPAQPQEVVTVEVALPVASNKGYVKKPKRK